MYENIRPGMTVRVHEKIKEQTEKGEKERIQIFEGLVIGRHAKNELEATITVRKVGADNIGVEKIFPVNAPTLAKIEPVRQAHTRRAKLYFVKGYSKKLREKAVKA